VQVNTRPCAVKSRPSLLLQVLLQLEMLQKRQQQQQQQHNRASGSPGICIRGDASQAASVPILDVNINFKAAICGSMCALMLVVPPS